MISDNDFFLQEVARLNPKGEDSEPSNHEPTELDRQLIASWPSFSKSVATKFPTFDKSNILLACDSTQPILAELAQSKVKGITCIVPSDDELAALRESLGSVPENVDFKTIQRTNLPFENDSVPFVLDTTTLDKLAGCKDEQGVSFSTLFQYLSEVVRVLQDGGSMILTSFLETHSLTALSSWLSSTGVLALTDVDINVHHDATSRFSACPFVITLTKGSHSNPMLPATIRLPYRIGPDMPCKLTNAFKTAVPKDLTRLVDLPASNALAVKNALFPLIYVNKTTFLRQKQLQTLSPQLHVSYFVWEQSQFPGAYVEHSSHHRDFVAPDNVTCAELGLPLKTTPRYTIAVTDAVQDTPNAPGTWQVPSTSGSASSKATKGKKSMGHVSNSTQPQVSLAVLLVPRGREQEWVFSTPDGHRSLAKQANAVRLLVVSLGKGQQHEAVFEKLGMQGVQKDLGPYIRLLLPSYPHVLTSGKKPPPLSIGQVPFLAVAPDLGDRWTVYESASDISGQYIVEELPLDEDEAPPLPPSLASAAGTKKIPVTRQLFFMSNQHAIQTEIHGWKTLPSTNAPADTIMDTAFSPSFLTAPAFEYHGYMLSLLSLLYSLPSSHTASPSGPVPLIFVLGAGGGALPGHILALLPRFRVIAVDIDAEMFRIAREAFGATLKGDIFTFSPRDSAAASDSNHLTSQSRALHAWLERNALDPSRGIECVHADAFDVLRALSASEFPSQSRPHAIIMDINAGEDDLKTGLSFPAPMFLSDTALTNVRFSLHQDGMFLINVGAKTHTLMKAVISTVQKHFEQPVAFIHNNEGTDLNTAVAVGAPIAQALISLGEYNREQKTFDTGKSSDEKKLLRVKWTLQKVKESTEEFKQWNTEDPTVPSAVAVLKDLVTKWLKILHPFVASQE